MASWVLCLVSPASGEGPRAKTASGTEASALVEEQAEVLFRRALVLMDAGKHARACPMLEESQRLDPGMGTRFRLAECYERTERLGEAFMLYRDVAAEARQKHAEDRAEVARARLSALGPRVAVVTVIVPEGVAKAGALSVTWDSHEIKRPLWNAGMAVTVGAHVLAATAPGKRTFRREVLVEEPGTLLELEVPPLEDVVTRRRIVLHPEPLPPALAPRDRRWIALGALVMGLGGLTMASIAGLSTWLGTSGTAGEPPRPEGSPVTNAAAIAGMSLAGVGVVAAGSLWFTAPAWDVRIAIAPGARGGAGVFRFSF